jgi:sphingosine-1-phosphate phosphatase 1
VAFWNVDYRFARQMNFVVCGGLLWGNLLKDVFRLPRPANVNKAVWVPTSATHMDSTACRDFGFPSTHAMNAVSNSLFTVLYVQQHHAALAGPWVLWGCLGVWVFSLALGRLYLGVHSPMDVKGGLGLGLAIALIMQRPCGFAETFDGILLHTPNVGAVLLAFLLALLVLNPQPRPMTPTFLQPVVTSSIRCIA